MTQTPRTDALMPCRNHPAMDLARALEMELAAVEENEQARWQHRIDPILARYVPGLDGSGVDSGDPLDLTEWELEKALATLAEQRDTLRTALEQYADPGNWHVGSKYDGESRSFTGPDEARKALEETEETEA